MAKLFYLHFLTVIPWIWVLTVIPINSAIILNKTLLAWQPPPELSKEFPYYLSGYDHENRPIFVLEWGRWNVKKYIEAGGPRLADAKTYGSQLIERLIEYTLNSTQDGDAPTLVGILDADGFSLDQLTDAPTLRYFLEQSLLLRRLNPFLHKCFVVNSNYAMQSLANLVKGIGGSLFERIEFYGTNKEKWQPQILEALPRDQVAPWYGGVKTFKPVAIFG